VYHRRHKKSEKRKRLWSRKILFHNLIALFSIVIKRCFKYLVFPYLFNKETSSVYCPGSIGNKDRDTVDIQIEMTDNTFCPKLISLYIIAEHYKKKKERKKKKKKTQQPTKQQQNLGSSHICRN
jgi:hypothetical protein